MTKTAAGWFRSRRGPRLLLLPRSSASLSGPRPRGSPLRLKPLLWLGAVLLVATCGQSITRDASVSIPDWVPQKFNFSDRSAIQPRFEEPEIIFTVERTACSPHRDATGQSDCATGTRRSVLTTGRDWRLGYENLFSFEFLIDPDLAYDGYRTSRAKETAGRASTLSIARWQGEDAQRNVLFDLKLDAKRGVTFLGRTCAPPSSFGTWQRVYVRVRWAEDDTGFLELRCGLSDIYSAPLVFARSDFPTTRALDCFPANICDPGVEKRPKQLSMQLGIIADPAPGSRAPSGIPPDGLTVRMRRLAERRLYVIFGREKNF